MRHMTGDSRQCWLGTLFFCLAAIAGSLAHADRGSVTEYVLPDGPRIYSNQPVAGGNPVKETDQVPGREASSDSRLTPFEKNATLPQLAGTERLDLIKDRLARGADPNAAENGRTPLQAAAAGGRAQIVDLLLRAGADPNLVPPKTYGRPPLCASAAGASRAHAEATRLLLGRGARPNDRCNAGHGPTPLMRAAETGHPESVRALLAAGADVNIVDWAPNSFPRTDTTALMYAAKNGQYEAVKLLLAAGANVNAKMLPNGWTALWLAADGRFAADGPSQRDYSGIARALLEQGADVSAAPSSDPRTPLLVAATNNTADFVKVLLEFGAKPTDRDREGQTALMHAAKRGDVEMSAALLAKGADPTATDNYGRTALQLATMLGFSEAARLLSEGATARSQPGASQAQAASKQVDTKARTLAATWQSEFPSGVARGPFLVGNIVLVSDWNGLVYGLDAASGRTIWTLQTKGTIASDPLVLDGVLYFGGAEGQSESGRGTVYALSLHSGKQVWSRDFSAAAQNLTLSGSMLFIENRDGKLFSVDARSGKTVWEESGSTRLSSAAISGGLVVATTKDGNLRAFDANTGREKWQLGTSRSNPKVSQFEEHLLKVVPEGEMRNAVISMGGEGLYIFGTGICDSLARGRTQRQVQDNFAEFFGPELAIALMQVARVEICPPGTTADQIAAATTSLQAAARAGEKVTTAPVADGAGHVFVGMSTGTSKRLVVGVDEQSGKRVFSASVEGYGASLPVLGAGLIFVQEGNNLNAFDLVTKSRIWSLDLQSQAYPDSTRMFYGGHLLIAGKTLLAVDAKTGVLTWRGGPQLQHATLLGVAAGTIYCHTWRNYYGVDAHTGAVLWATALIANLPGPSLSHTAYSKEMFFHAHGNYVFGVRTADRSEARH